MFVLPNGFGGPAWNLVESFIDNVCRDQVVAVPGCVVYCDLAFGYAEHSGIYVGNRGIVQLSGNGCIEAVNPPEFLSGTTGISIYASCRGAAARGDAKVAARARSMVGGRRSYNFLMDNCHQFSAGCLTGDFDNADNFLWMLKDTAADVLAVDTWRVCAGFR